MSFGKRHGAHRPTVVTAASALLLAAVTVMSVSCSRGGPAPLGGSGRSAVAAEGDFVRIAERTLPSVVSISCEVAPRATAQAERQLYDWFKERDIPVPPEPPDDERSPMATSMGSGWIYSPDGFIVTNAHVVRDALSIRVQLSDRPGDNRQYRAELWATDPKSELAVIKVEPGRPLPALRLGDSERLAVGSWVMAIGSPFALQQTVTVGVVSAKGRLLPGQETYITIGDVIQTDASINVGNSGGPLMNLRGEVVGINVAIASPTGGRLPVSVGIGFAIPAATAAHVVPKLIAQREVARGWLGVSIEDLSPNMRDFYGAPDGGALVNRTFAEGPGATSGLREDDVIIAVDNIRIASTWDLQKAISHSAPGATVTLRLIRDGEQTTLAATLGNMPAKYTGRPEHRQPSPPPKPELGLEVKLIDAKLKEKLGLRRDEGVVVTEVKTNSLARGKLAAGDVILRVNHDQVQSPAEYEEAVEKARSSERGYMLLRAERVLADGEVTRLTADIPLQP